MTTTTAQIEQLLNDRDCTWEHQPALELRSIDLVASITNQSRFEPIDQPTVDRYVAALEDGAEFPPIIVRRIPAASVKAKDRLVIAGGNHRARAHIDAGRKTIDAYVVVCDDLVALEIAYSDNATHGLPPTDPERLQHARILIDQGRLPSEAARTVGISEQKVYKHLAAINVEKRAAECGVAVELAEIGVGIRPRLGSLKDDRVFTKVIRAIVKERIGQTASQKLIGDINAQPDVAGALDLLQAHINHHRANQGAGRSVGKPSTNPYLMLRTALGTIRGLNASDTVHAARNQRERDELARLCMDGARHLKAIHDLATADDKPDLKVVG